MHQPPRIETPRLVITWPDREQVEAYYRSITGTDIFDTLIWDGPSCSDDLHDYWARSMSTAPSELGDHLNLAVIERNSGWMIGGMSWRPVNGNAAIVDIGYAFAKAWHRRGLATEAVRAMVDFGFAARGAERVFATVFVGNVASRRVLEKCGFAYEGLMRRAVCKRGEWRDEWLLAITRPDWLRGREIA